MSRGAALGAFSVLLTLAVGAHTPAVADDAPNDQLIDGLALRSIGPSVSGGRIADIAVHPTRRSTWYVAAGSGGVWKTVNAGITWSPLFDDQATYSIGEITLDPQRPDTVWVGTGENVSGRHVAWGNGVYRSLDGGHSWQAMGLARSEHIGRILVHPQDSKIILVAAEGPLWADGGERGVYRSTDGGESWTRVLHVDERTGATDLEFHPTDPSIVYAATYDRRRTVWSLLAGGTGSGLWKSTDGGVTWRRLSAGLPPADAAVGKIGIAVTPAAPDRVYATIEADADHLGLYASEDAGERWQRRAEYISGGTGPHYYQELEASPRNADHLYQMDVFMHVSRDGGRTFTELGTGREKHSDNHALWIDPDDPTHLIAGTDGGLYESFDDGRKWRHFPNLPISQFYKVALSNRTPYYDVLAGAQDLGTLHGPSRTLHTEGVRNQDWYVSYGADGYGVAFDPLDPDVFYQMSQNGNLVRHHRPSEEDVYIRPQPAPGDPPERWNWDSPLLVSEHAPQRLYFASQRLWRSDDRGDSWTPISGDLTTNANRFELPVGGRVRSADALWDLRAMSRYATLTAISESPRDGARLWTGSDDGLVHTSDDGGERWRQVTPPPLPAQAFINDVEASQHAVDGAFIAADNHKTGDYKPYLFATDDGGRSWRDISGNLADGVIVWAIQQDHIEPNLLFLGAENGLYVTLDGGKHWRRFSAGVPTISFRDVKLQRRDDDVVGATFGRGLYVLDDYGPLRAAAADLRQGGDGIPGDDAGALFAVRDAWWFLPAQPGQAIGLPTQGSSAWRTPNPPHGAVFNVFLSDVPLSAKKARREQEQSQAKDGADVAFPGFETLRDEALAGQTRYALEVSAEDGTPVRRLSVAAKEGLQRVAWNMRTAPGEAIDLSPPGFSPPWFTDPEGALMGPGTYRVQLIEVSDQGVRTLGSAESFTLHAVDNLPPDADPATTVAFRVELLDLSRRLDAVNGVLKEIDARLPYLRTALERTPSADASLYQAIDDVRRSVAAIQETLRGNPARAKLNEPDRPGVISRLYAAGGALATRMAPTATQRENMALARSGLEDVEARVERVRAEQLAAVESALAEAGAPWTPGQRIGARD
ncbi:MAG: glycosyl hydrolase [Pseudomonadota bacterium]